MTLLIKEITQSESLKTFEDISRLFKDMYQYMGNLGIVYNLMPQGEELWINSIKSTLGKIHLLFVAQFEGQCVAFIYGNIKLTPPYLGTNRIGFISHVYVKDSYRSHGIGNDLVDIFLKKLDFLGVKHIELEVLEANIAAKMFWIKQGFTLDTLKYYKVIHSSDS